MPQQQDKVNPSNHLPNAAVSREAFSKMALPPAQPERPLRFDIKWPQELSGANASIFRSSFSDLLRSTEGQLMFRADGPASFRLSINPALAGKNYPNGYEGWSSYLFDNLKIKISPNTMRELAPLAATLYVIVKGELSIGTKLGNRANLQVAGNTHGRFSIELRIQ